MKLRKHLATILLAFTLIPTLAHSTLITTFTDRTAFVNSIGMLATIDENFDTQSLNLFTSGFTLDLGDFIVSSTDVASDNIGIVDGVPTQNLGTNQSVDGSRFFGIEGRSGGPSFKIAFGTNRFIFGFDWLDGDSTDSYALDVLGEVFENPPFGRNTVGRGFFGIISDTAFNEVNFYQTAAGGYIGGFGIDNLITSQIDVVTCTQDPSLPQCSASVPEPSTIAIFALGIRGLASRRFKKQS
jgi:hypothetical protein